MATHEGTVDWTTAVNNGASFVYLKATEGTDCTATSTLDRPAGGRRHGFQHGTISWNSGNGALPVAYS
ncbi:GH25 family lysozyme [Amycolatopsis sp.]|uniref:GH25 family lysozyme n=1 Tax=Amycolatopsis sp. TaxID=37632 RepID=UPI002B7624D1|nr:GH25 family lysozyme [Amycolatopsis sp.]HVV13685.1 GH25 family lysozyme [Amycolatopsis sp.]